MSESTTKTESAEFILTAQEVKTVVSTFGQRVSAEDGCAALFGKLHARCMEVLDCSEVKAVQVVKAQLAVTLAPHYAEEYIDKVLRLVSADFRASSGMEPARAKGGGRKPETTSYIVAQAVIALVDRIAGAGVAPTVKQLRQGSKLLLALAGEKITLADIKAILPTIPVVTATEQAAKDGKVEAGKVVSIPAQPVKPVAKAA